MLIQALREVPGEAARCLVTVDVPDPTVIDQLSDVRVVATFAHLADGDGDYPRLDRLEPLLIVEVRSGEDALGQPRWSRMKSGHALNALAEMIKRFRWTQTLADYPVTDVPVEATT
jgi:hypothetical protein